MNLPNIITLLRIAATPIAVWLILEGQLMAAFWVFVAAGLSDAVDGFIAKQFDMETELGKFLDPLADKALLVSVYISLGLGGYLPTWLVIMVVFRDVMIVGGAMLFETMTHSLTMQPLMISKVNTTLQIVLAAGVMANAGYGIEFDGGMDVLVILTAMATVASGLTYAVVWVRRWAQLEDDQ
ncbi:CDP-alcohol phosphatidyltransferase family protein [Magnetovibrio blakemorei]|uniref:CDP-diacylglycerol--glycerol-3-phosphate 3-phosphatidyltransferase n=1 Tax=Magnetovibrio blakemorei TaxID=28181 RepID=A0A1E5Q5L4_9PROT|nr:CDP-alcohol phosphatidyltransferase family protein [Magnetovibrio blakemorei]OEJ65598.1 CDP-alcohol phosphatidyltransferase [Magnetovibrio blakemorei]